jgi:hypothetical protein
MLLIKGLLHCVGFTEAWLAYQVIKYLQDNHIQLVLMRAFKLTDS